MTPLEKRYNRIAGEAREVVGKKHPAAKLIISFGEGDCIVDVLRPGEPGKRYVYIPEED